MKAFLFVSCILLASCNNFKSNHPQAEVGSSTPVTETDIRHYADSINASVSNMDKKVSLVYTLGDYSFYTVQFSYNGIPVLYCEYGTSGEYGSNQHKYYLKDGHLLLYTEQKAKIGTIQSTNEYFRNDVKFYTESKSADDSASLAQTAFTKTSVTNKNYSEDLQKLSDAIGQKGKFQLVFDGITDDPKARYLVLSKSEINSYRAPLLVKTGDPFIDSLTRYQDSLKGKKLNLKWRIEDSEAIYVSGETMH
ncbi:hypothetical protein GS399_12325 [Pedobacter sp. HMF7647]|uniref:Uncharacterized protein n=1 Tax=Hufsiella arboris TaxID=2695275 RepID=A0A7K1YB00_9SPHI|nr:hypothetical protein [Hufsiella arboris]MXV51762.1 hypothetical protein [Hufsiella arboris]